MTPIRLVRAGKVLTDNQTLEDANVTQGDEVWVVKAQAADAPSASSAASAQPGGCRCGCTPCNGTHIFNGRGTLAASSEYVVE